MSVENPPGANPESGVGQGGNGNGARNVRQRVAVVPDWACQKLPPLIQNIRQKPGATTSGQRINRSWELQSLEDLVHNGGRHGTVSLFKIMKIASNKSDDKMKVQIRARGGRNQNASAVRWQRSVTLLCLLSSTNGNMCMLFHGCGNNTQLFANELSMGSMDLREFQHSYVSHKFLIITDCAVFPKALA